MGYPLPGNSRNLFDIRCVAGNNSLAGVARQGLPQVYPPHPELYNSGGSYRRELRVWDATPRICKNQGHLFETLLLFCVKRLFYYESGDVELSLI